MILRYVYKYSIKSLDALLFFQENYVLVSKIFKKIFIFITPESDADKIGRILEDGEENYYHLGYEVNFKI